MAQKKHVRAVPAQFILIAAAILVFAPLLSFYFASNIENELRDNTFSSLSEMTQQQVALVNSRIEGQFYVLRNLAKNISQTDIGDERVFLADADFLANTAATGDFSLLLLANSLGSAVSDDGTRFYISSEEAFARSMNGESCVIYANNTNFSAQPGFLFSVPVIDSGGSVVGVVLAGYSSEQFSDFLVTHGFEGTAHTHIRDSAGNIIAACSHENSMQLIEPQEISNIRFEGDMSLDLLKSDMLSSESRTISFSYNDNNEYVSYAPLGVNDWYAFCVVDSDAANDEKAIINKYATVLAFGFFFLGILILFIVWSFEKKRLRTEVDEKYKPRLIQLSEKASHDSLTGLYNHEAAENAVNAFLSGEGSKGIHAFFMIDIDNFKMINDTFGHAEGDETLISVAVQLRKIFRSDDIVARMGGDEYMVFMRNVFSKSFVSVKAQEVCESLQFIRTGGEHQMNVTSSVGVAICDNTETAFENLYRQADEALYQAKNSGKSRYEIYDGEFISEVYDARTPQQITNTAVQYKALLEYLDAGILLLEITDKINILYASKGFYNISHIPRPDNGDKSDLILSLMDQQDRARLDAMLFSGAQSGELVNYVYRSEDPMTHDIYYRSIRAVRIPYEGSESPVMIAAITDVTDLKRTESELVRSGNLLKTAFEQLDGHIYEIDLNTRTFYDRTQTAERYMYKGAAVSDVPEAFIIDGTVHKDSVNELREFYRKMYRREPSSACLVLLKNAQGAFVWQHMKYTLYKDETDEYARALILSTQAGDMTFAVKKFEREKKLYEAVNGRILASCIVNLSKDTVVKRNYKEKDLFNDSPNVSYPHMHDTIKQRIFGENDLYSFNTKFSPNALTEAFRQGIDTVSHEYRMESKSGLISWIRKTADLIAEPESGDIYAFIYTKKSTENKKWSEFIELKPERETASGLYNEKTFSSLVTALTSQHSSGREKCALACINIESSGNIGDTYGINISNKLIGFTGKLMRLTISSHFLVGYLNTSLIAVFSPLVTSEERFVKNCGEMREYLFNTLSDAFGDSRMKIKAGISIQTKEFAAYDGLLADAIKALDNIGADTDEAQVALFKSNLVENKVRHNAEICAEKRSYFPEYAFSAKLTKAFGSIAASENPMEKTLEVVEEHYKAAKVYYALKIYDDKNKFTLQEQFSSNKENERNDELRTIELSLPEFSGIISADKNPLVADAALLRERYPKFYKQYALYGINNVILSPVFDTYGLWGAIICEEPSVNESDAVFISALGNYAVSEMTSSELRDIKTRFMRTDPLTGVMNRYSFVQNTEALRQTALNSAGVLSVDINGLKYINRDYGDAYGDELIKKTADILTKEFGSTNVYRYSGDEFMAVLLDMTQDIFEKKCRTVKALLKENMQNIAASGYAWSDEAIDIQKLIIHAQEYRNIAKSNFKFLHESKSFDVQASWAEDLTENIAAGNLKLYLQPKAHVDNMTIAGAEALCRLKLPGRAVITPDKFIPRAERSGMISKIDMFMLEHTLQWISGCIDKGLPALPISVNFSRLTAISEDMVQTVSAICDKYPMVDRSLIEIEITESMGEIERPALAKASANIRSLGFKLSLDDFGSEYSSLSVLSSMRFDVLKLDKSLITNILTDEMSRITVKNVISMCAEAGIDSVAEGVETTAQYELLRTLGCDLIQGYLIEKPIPCEDFEKKYLCTPSKLW